MASRAPLYGWLASEAVSLTGTRVSMIAIPWFVLTTTGSATQTGVVAFAEMAPLVAMKALGGPLIDRVGARRVAVACDLGSVVAVGLIPLLYAAGLLSFPLLLVIVTVAGALRGPGDAGKHAMVPDIVAHSRVPTERVTGLTSVVERTAGVSGAAVGGVLVAVIGPANALVVDALSFGLSAVVLAATTRSIRTAPAKAGHAGPSSYRRELRAGWEFLRRDRLLFGIAVMVALTNLVDQAYTVLLVPVWAKETGQGVAAVGALFAVFSGAAILGSVAAAAWAGRLPRYRTYLVAFLLCGAPKFWVLAAEAPLRAVLAVAVVGGVAAGFINPILGAVIYERIPAGMVGRVTSLTTAMAFVLIPFGGVLGGGLVAGLGLAWALVIFGAAYLVVTMAPAVDPRWREMDERPTLRDPGRVPEGAA